MTRKKREPLYRRGPPTPETRAKIAQALRGRPHDDDRKRKMSLARKRFLRRQRKVLEAAE